MKKILTIFALLPILGFASVAHAEIKVATVDMNKIFQGYWKTKQAENSINEAKASAKKELDSKKATSQTTYNEITKMNTDLQKSELSKTKKAAESKKRDEKIAEFNTQMKEIKQFTMSREQDLQQRAVRMRNDIVKKIQDLINAKAKSSGYDYVLDVSGKSLNGVPVILYSKSDVDFTNEIIKEMNKDEPKDTAPAKKSSTKKK